MRKLAIIRFTATILTVLFLSFVIVFFISTSRKVFTNHSAFSLKTIVQEKVSGIETEISYAEQSIRLFADFVSSQMTERELKNPNEVFARYSRRLPFDLVEYIRWDGLNFMNSIAGSEPFDASERIYYKEGIKGKSGIWPNLKPKFSKEVLLNFYTPLYYNGEISGVITGAIGETTSFKSRLVSSFFGHQIQSFICDEDYIVVSSACEGINPGLDIKKHKNVKILSDFMEHSQQNNIEPFKYEINGNYGLCCTATVKNNGWHVVVIVYPSVLAAIENEISGSMFYISVAIIIILFLYLVISLSVQAKSNKMVQEDLKNSAIRDGLTGLLNRRAYAENLKKIEAEGIGENFHYIAFDVNGLKSVNDNLGHEAGDELIKAASDSIESCFGKYGSVYRVGGDEFIAIIDILDSEIGSVKENFLKITSSWSGKYSSSLVIPAGIASRKEMPDASIMEMIKVADQRMYREKSLIYIASGIDRRAKNAAYEVLCESYTKILKINLATDDFSIIQMNPNERMESKGYSEKISQWLYNFATSGQVHKDDVEMYLSRTTISYMKDYFSSGKKEISIQYRRLIDGDFCKVLMEIKPSKEYSESNPVCFLYVKNIDK